jgi:hypothetical protein
MLQFRYKTGSIVIGVMAILSTRNQGIDPSYTEAVGVPPLGGLGEALTEGQNPTA